MTYVTIVLTLPHQHMTTYVPFNGLDSEIVNWEFTTVRLTYTKLIANGAVEWCHKVMSRKWTMRGPTPDKSGFVFGFENAGDATVFHLKFGF